MMEWQEIEKLLKKLTTPHQEVCWLLAEGFSQAKAARKSGFSEARISQLVNNDQDFREALDALSQYVGLASRAARLRLAQRAALQFEDDEGNLDLEKSLLDWIKHIATLMEEDISRVQVIDYVEPKSMEELMTELEEKEPLSKNMEVNYGHESKYEQETQTQ